MSTPEEQLRLSHYHAEQAARDAVVPAPTPQPPVPGHSAEILSKHEGMPTVAAQEARQAGEDISDLC
jgi:hypothetical protein